MAKRKSHKPVEPLGHSKAKIIYTEIEDPGYQRQHHGAKGNDKMHRVAINMHESPAAYWFYNGKIDAAQYRAAVDFRRWYEAVGGAGAGAIDYSQTKVDGGGKADTFSERREKAGRALKNVHRLLGVEGYEAVETICGQCRTLTDAYPRQYERRQKTEQCKLMLTYLAEYLDYKGRQIRKSA